MAGVSFRIPAVLFLGVFIACAGCASSASSRFYQLNSLKKENSVTKDISGQRLIVAIGPLMIPDYLDRPQIVTRSGKNEIRLADFDRWAGSLEKDVVRVLAEDISSLLPEDRFVVVQWVSAAESAGPSLYRVEVNIVRFEGTSKGAVELKAQWAIFHREKGLLLRRESVISEEVRGTGYGPIVTALSDALAGLSRNISEAIIAL